jgi:hypothetical protein
VARIHVLRRSYYCLDLLNIVVSNAPATPIDKIWTPPISSVRWIDQASPKFSQLLHLRMRLVESRKSGRCRIKVVFPKPWLLAVDAIFYKKIVISKFKKIILNFFIASPKVWSTAAVHLFNSMPIFAYFWNWDSPAFGETTLVLTSRLKYQKRAGANSWSLVLIPSKMNMQIMWKCSKTSTIASYLRYFHICLWFGNIEKRWWIGGRS